MHVNALEETYSTPLQSPLRHPSRNVLSPQIQTTNTSANSPHIEVPSAPFPFSSPPVLQQAPVFLSPAPLSDEQLLQLLLEIQMTPVATITRIPKNLRVAFRAAFLAAISNICNSPNSLEAHFRLFALPKFVMAFHKSVPGQPTRGQTEFTKLRLEEWDRAPITLIAETIMKSTRPAYSNTDNQNTEYIKLQNIRRATKLMHDKRLGMALKALTSNGVHTASEKVYNELLQKHPQLPPPSRSPSLPTSLKLSEESVNAAINSFSQSSGTGPSSFRSFWIIQILECPQHGDLLSMFTVFLNRMVKGEFPVAISPFYNDATLIPLRKANDGIRPIAVGECLRRICGKACMLQLRTKASTLFHPFQLGVGTKCGAEAITHTVTEILSRLHNDDQHGLIQVDYENAFNNFDRGSLFESIREFFPEVVAYLEWIYAIPPYLFYDGKVIMSGAGVQQGDPLGPLFFATLLHKLTVKLGETGLLHNSWYLDDGTLIGNVNSLRSALDILKCDSPSLGLKLNLNKCYFYWPQINSKTVDMFPDIPFCHNSHTNPGSRGIMVLGCPVGPKEYVCGSVQERVHKIEVLLDKITDFDDPQLELILLRSCIGMPKFNFILRCLPGSIIGNEIEAFDTAISHYLSKIAGFSLTPRDRVFWSLPFSFGGFAIPIAKNIAPLAYVSSVAQTLPLQCKLGSQGPPPLFESMLEYVTRSLTQQIETEFIPFSPSELKQSTLAVKLHELQQQELVASSSELKSIILQHSQPGALKWLIEVPRPFLKTCIPKEDFSLLLRYHSGMPVHQHVQICPFCNLKNDSVDSHKITSGTHALSCQKFNSETNNFHQRHNRIVKTLGGALKSAGFAFEYEEKAPGNSSNERPGDIRIKNWSGSNDTWIDVSIIGSLCDSYIRYSSADVGGAAIHRRKSKIQEYRHLTGFDFRPICMETIGSWDPDALVFLNDLAVYISRRKFITQKRALHELIAKLSFALQQHNGFILANYDYCARQSGFTSDC
jgi:hypothetical protein